MTWRPSCRASRVGDSAIALPSLVGTSTPGRDDLILARLLVDAVAQRISHVHIALTINGGPARAARCAVRAGAGQRPPRDDIALFEEFGDREMGATRIWQQQVE
jgi:hypothetical protein